MNLVKRGGGVLATSVVEAAVCVLEVFQPTLLMPVKPVREDGGGETLDNERVI